MVNKVRTRRRCRQKNKISQHSNRRIVKRSKKFTQKRVKRSKKFTQKRVKRSKRLRNSRRAVRGGSSVVLNSNSTEADIDEVINAIRTNSGKYGINMDNMPDPNASHFFKPDRYVRKRQRKWLNRTNNQIRLQQEIKEYFPLFEFNLGPKPKDNIDKLQDILAKKRNYDNLLQYAPRDYAFEEIYGRRRIENEQILDDIITKLREERRKSKVNARFRAVVQGAQDRFEGIADNWHNLAQNANFERFRPYLQWLVRMSEKYGSSLDPRRHYRDVKGFLRDRAPPPPPDVAESQQLYEEYIRNGGNIQQVHDYISGTDTLHAPSHKPG